MVSFRDTVDHQVCSGVVLLVANPDSSSSEQFLTHTFYETTDVKFGAVSDDTLKRYVDTGEPM